MNEDELNSLRSQLSEAKALAASTQVIAILTNRILVLELNATAVEKKLNELSASVAVTTGTLNKYGTIVTVTVVFVGAVYSVITAFGANIVKIFGGK